MADLEEFAEVQLDLGIDDGSVGGPEFQTHIVTLGGGVENANVGWSNARGRWEIGERLISTAQAEYLNAFFRARRGRAVGFRYKDWHDYYVTGEAQLVPDGIEDDYTLVKVYTSAPGTSYFREITKPVAGTVTIFIDAVEQTEGVDYTLDTTTGVISYTTAPSIGDVITVDYEFDVPVRFDSDRFRTEMRTWREVDRERFFWLHSLPIIEKKQANWV